MPKAIREMLKNGNSYDETDRMPDNISVSNFDLFMYVVAIVGHLADLGIDINVAVRYYLAGMVAEFGWTLAFILVPAFVNTAVSIRMYSQDKQQDSVTNEITRRRWLRIFILVLQMAPILRFTDALIYAIKSRQAEQKKDPTSQRMYYGLMLKEDSDAALLRIFECFLEAAPQHVLQTSLLLALDQFAVHQILSICSSIVSMAWCLAAYQRSIRYTQQDKLNMNWKGTGLQIVWHFFVSLSRIISISIIAYLFPYWTILACIIHILIMTICLQLFDRSPFCSHNKLAELAFSLALGAVYLFTYILPTEGRTRYRYGLYYSVCFIENFACGVLWFIFVRDSMRESLFFYPMLCLTVLPYLLGLTCMLVYYTYFHPKVRKGVSDFTVTFKRSDNLSDVS